MKHKTTIKRQDGTRITVVAEDMTTPFNSSLQIGVYVIVDDDKVYSNGDVFKVLKPGEYLRACRDLQLKIEKPLKECSCRESEFLQILPKFNKYQVFCVNCGNTGQAMSTPALAIEEWNRSNRLQVVPAKSEYANC